MQHNKLCLYLSFLLHLPKSLAHITYFYLGLLNFGPLAGDATHPNISFSLFLESLVINLPVPIVFYGVNRTFLEVSVCDYHVLWTGGSVPGIYILLRPPWHLDSAAETHLL